MIETPSQITTAAELDSLLKRHPDLCYEGWRTKRMSETDFADARQKLRTAVGEIDLCRRLLSDARFLRAHGNRTITAYHLKHIAESWNFTEPDREFSSPPRHNGYVCQGSAAAAALLEGFETGRDGAGGLGSVIRIPKL